MFSEVGLLGSLWRSLILILTFRAPFFPAADVQPKNIYWKIQGAYTAGAQACSQGYVCVKFYIRSRILSPSESWKTDFGRELFFSILSASFKRR